jgi:parvulin-like peptidyl-prolyl isomerase
VELLKASNPSMKDREISDEEKKQARDFYAKIQIYQDEFDRKAASGELDKGIVDRANLQVKLQQAQFLARIYSESLKDKLKVTDEDVDKYIAEHPELDTSTKKAKAQEILERAKAGEDFAKLADEYSEDPGNKGPDGKGKGGLYEKINLGQMVEPFEKAALALEPGQIAPELVETDFGYHIIKLEKKGQVSGAKGADGKVAETYDARHILIATTQSDPDNPMSRPMPIKQFVRQKLESEKQKAELDKVLAENHVSVPDDFDVPQVSDEDIKKSMQGQMPGGMSIDGDEATPPDAAPDAKKPEAKKPEPKKK